MSDAYCIRNFILAHVEDFGGPPTVQDIAKRHHMTPKAVERALDDLRLSRDLPRGLYPDACNRYTAAVRLCGERYGAHYCDKDVARLAGVDEGVAVRWAREFGRKAVPSADLGDALPDPFAFVESSEVSDAAKRLYVVMLNHEMLHGEILSQPELAEKLGRSVPRIQQLRKELKDAGLIPDERLNPGDVPCEASDPLTEEEMRRLDLWWFWYDVSGRRSAREQKVPNLSKMAEIWECSKAEAKATARNLERKGWVSMEFGGKINRKRRNRGSLVTLLKHPTETWRQPASNY